MDGPVDGFRLVPMAAHNALVELLKKHTGTTEAAHELWAEILECATSEAQAGEIEAHVKSVVSAADSLHSYYRLQRVYISADDVADQDAQEADNVVRASDGLQQQMFLYDPPKAE